MIDTQAIRNKILDLAMRGQLTEQLPEDGTADELYERIIARKQELIKAGAIKKDKQLKQVCSTQILARIPDNWKWVSLGTIITLQSGQDLKSDEYNSSSLGIPYLTGASNLDEKGRLIINRWTEQPKSIAVKGDVLLSCKGTVGKLAILEVESAHIARQFMAIRTYEIDVNFVEFFMESVIEGIKKAQKGLIPGIERNDVLLLNIPLPPLEEQKRIVEKIEQAFSILDAIDTLQAQYSDNLSALKAKLIDAAIQGKLTEQLPEDGTAEELYAKIQEEKQALIKAGKIKKEKPLPEITEDEIPFNIPKNWKWVRLSSVIDVRDGTHDTPKYYNQGIPLITSKNLSSGKLDFSDVKLISYADAEKINGRSHVERGDILFAMIGTIGNPVIVDTDREFCIKNVALFKRFHGTQFNMEYLLFYLLKEQNELKKISLGGLQPFVSLKLFRAHPFPLPPLDEQNRIVAVLKDILLMCEG